MRTLSAPLVAALLASSAVLAPCRVSGAEEADVWEDEHDKIEWEDERDKELKMLKVAASLSEMPALPPAPSTTDTGASRGGAGLPGDRRHQP